MVLTIFNMVELRILGYLQIKPSENELLLVSFSSELICSFWFVGTKVVPKKSPLASWRPALLNIYVCNLSSPL